MDVPVKCSRCCSGTCAGLQPETSNPWWAHSQLIGWGTAERIGDSDDFDGLAIENYRALAGYTFVPTLQHVVNPALPSVGDRLALVSPAPALKRMDGNDLGEQAGDVALEVVLTRVSLP